MSDYFKNFETVKIGHALGKLKKRSATASAAMRGQFDSLIFLHRNDYPITLNTALTAAYNGHHEIFRYCFDNYGDDQKFWDCHHNIKLIIDHIDLTDPIWERLLKLNLSQHKNLQKKISYFRLNNKALKQNKNIHSNLVNYVVNRFM